jgi:hypothetical protein
MMRKDMRNQSRMLRRETLLKKHILLMLPVRGT